MASAPGRSVWSCLNPRAFSQRFQGFGLLSGSVVYLYEDDAEMKDSKAPQFFSHQQESSACGVGFVAVRGGEPDHHTLEQALGALIRLEHRGGCGADRRSSDGAGVMTELPFELFNETPGRFAVANLFLAQDPNRRDAHWIFLSVPLGSWVCR